ncbi:type VII secretion target [Nocardia sp. NPDC052566]|uniref:type VII secretion target n=1 Tax=Nocardia sp. NPDC052566 TaxID=3364330 RepID=UPI0037CA40C8
MRKMSADTEGIAAYAASADVMSGEMAAAGVSAAGAEPALLGPIFGLVGGDFMAAYAAVHAGHVAAIGQLAAVLTSIGGATSVAAAALTETDRSTTDAITSASSGLDV